MAAKYAIALREARESLHWLRVLVRAEVLLNQTHPMAIEADEFVAMLTSAVKKLRSEA
jgi:four helix bundle protein